MSDRQENIRLRIETISDLPDAEKQLLAINDALRAQATLLAQLASNTSSQSSSQVASINAVTTALNAQRTAATAAGTAAASAGAASTTASTAATTAATAHTAATTAATTGYTSMGSAVRDFTGLIAGAFAVNEIKNFGSDIIDAKTKIDSLKISLDVMLGSKKESAQLFAEMVTLAKQTPFSLEEVAENVVKLKAYNIATAELIPTITSLGNIAAAVGKEKLPQLTLAYGQVQNFGKLMGTELRQFTEAGVPLFDLLATSMGKTREEVIKLTEDHRIMATDVKKAIMDASEAGGKYYNLMALQAKTLGGEVSNLGDTFFVAKARVGDYFEGAIKNGIRTLADLLTATVGSNSAIERTSDIVKSAAAFMATLTLVTKAQAAADAISVGYQTAKNVVWGEFLLIQRAAAGGWVTFTAAEVNAMVAAEGFNAALAANPIGAVVAALGILVTAYYAYQAINDEVTTQLGEQEVALRTEQSELNALTKAAMNAAEGTQARKNAIDLLIQKYPDYFKGINSETASNGDLKSILDKVNASYMTRISLARQAYALEGVSSEQKQLLQTEAEFFKSLGNEQIKIQFGGDIQKFVETLNSGSAAAVRLKAQLNDTASGGAEFFGAAANSIAGNFKKVEGDYATINTNMQLSDAARVQTAIAAENERWKKQSAELKKGTDAYEAAEKNHLDAVAKINGTFHEAVVKSVVDTAEKTKQVTLLSASEIAVITRGANADTLAEKLKLLDAQEKAEIETVNKRTVNRKISDSALEEMERQAAARILAIHEEYQAKRDALQLKADTEARDNRSRSLEVDIAAMQARIDKQREADGQELITSFTRTEGYKETAKAAKESEKQIQDARKETHKINEETATIEAETRKKTIDSLVQMVSQVSGIGGQLAAFSIKAIADIDLLSGKAASAAQEQLTQANFSLDLMRKMYDDNDAAGQLKIANAEQGVAKANENIAKTSALSAEAVFSVFGMAAQVLQTIAGIFNEAAEARRKATIEAIDNVRRLYGELNQIMVDASKAALQSQLEDTRLSYQERDDLIRAHYRLQREMAEDHSALDAQLAYAKGIAEIDFKNAREAGAALIRLRAERANAERQIQIDSYQLDIEEAARVLELKKQQYADELAAYKATKQAEIDTLTATLAQERQLNAQYSSDDQLRLQEDENYRRRLLVDGEAREVAALEAAKQRELVRAAERGASAQETSEIVNAFEKLIADKHTEYQTAIGNKSAEISLANEEVKAQESATISALEAKTTGEVNALKQQIADKDVETNFAMERANRAYNEAKRQANYATFEARKQLLIAEVSAEIAILRGRRAPSGIINDLIGALNQISGQQNPFVAQTEQVVTAPDTGITNFAQFEALYNQIVASRTPSQIVNGAVIPTTVAYTKEGKRIQVSFNETPGSGFDAFDQNMRPIFLYLASGLVPETGQRFFKGTEFVQGPGGIDNVPAMLTQGERVLTVDQNKALAGMTNDRLVETVGHFDRLMAQYPQLMMPGAGPVLRLPDGIMNSQGGHSIDLSQVVGKLNDVHSALKNQKLLHVNIDRNGTAIYETGLRSKISYYDNLFRR